jgi:hypothetical protein
MLKELGIDFLSSQQTCDLFLRSADLSFGVKSVLKSDQ